MFWLFLTPRLVSNHSPTKIYEVRIVQIQFPAIPLPSKNTHLLRVQVRIARRVESINRFRSGREGVKGRDLEKRYPAEKAKKLMDLLRSKGLWYWDEDFPQDEED